MDLLLFMAHCLAHSRPSVSAHGENFDLRQEMGSDVIKHFVGMTWVPDSGAYSETGESAWRTFSDPGAQGRPDYGGKCWPFLCFLFSFGLLGEKGRLWRGARGLTTDLFQGYGKMTVLF